MKSRYSFVVIAILGLTIVHLIGKPSHAAPLNQVNGLLLGASGPIPDGSETFAVWTSAGTVPVPAAIWLFGTALLGFVGMSRRRKVAW